MMRLSTKGRYATRLMLDLALHCAEGPVFLKDVAERQEISPKYLGQLIPSLKTAGLISARRGARGGYTLAKLPQEITLKEIVQAAEGNLALAECVLSPEVCARGAFCVARDLWGELSERLQEALESTSLLDMVNRHREKQQVQPLAYSI